MTSRRLGLPAARCRILAGLVCASATVAGAVITQPPLLQPWVAPTRAARKPNPEHRDAHSIQVGKAIFERECLSCHGAKGLGDGPKAADLERHPGNLALPSMWDESDGALFWKISEGNAPMPATKTLLSDDERWHVINYVRTLAPADAAPTPPQYAAPDGCRKAVSAVIKAYEPVRIGLAGGSDGTAAAKAAPVLSDAVGALRAADSAALPEAAKTAWSEDAAACAAAVDKLLGAGGDIAKLREAFVPVSASLLRAVERYGHAEPVPVLVFADAPAAGGEVRVWLQADAKVQDPYGVATDKQAPKKRLGGQQGP